MAERSWLVAAAVAVAVLGVVGAGVVMSTGGSSGSSGPGGSAGPASSGDSAAGHGDATSGGGGSTGGGSSGAVSRTLPSAEPGRSPSGAPSSLPATPVVAPRDQAPVPDLPVGLTIQSYELPAPDRLHLRYATGVPQCYGRLDRAAVSESAERVVVTLLVAPARAPATQPCPEIALVRDTVVALSAPLGDRVVVDGAQQRRVPRGHEMP